MIVESGTQTDLHTSLSRDFLDGEISPEWREQSVTLRLPFAEIDSREWCFDGIRVAYSDWRFKQPQQVAYEGTVANDVVTLYFNLKGGMQTIHKYKNKDQAFEIGPYQHNMFYSGTSSGSLASRENRHSSFMIQFSLPAFVQMTTNTTDVLDRFSADVLSGRSGALSKGSLNLGGHMYQVIESMQQCSFSSGMKRLFFLSKTIELLVLQAESFGEAQRIQRSYLRTEYDRERIRYARDFLIKHMENPPGLPALARECGLNEYKLKKGFREMYGTSVFNYLATERLELARRELLDSGTPPSQLAIKLGYSSPQHFSTAFKTKFGVSPKMFAVRKW